MNAQNISKVNILDQEVSKNSSAKQPAILAPRRRKPKPKVKLADLPDLLTVREVADILRVSPLTIKRWGKRGKLPAIRINSRGDRRYKKEAVLWLLGMQVE